MAELSTVELATPAGTDDRWSMFVAGDYAVDRTETPTPATTLSSGLRERIAAADVSLVNFEAPLVDAGAEPVAKSGPVIANHDAAGVAVADAGFDVCTLANNHVRDFGPDGVESTVDELQGLGLETVGVGETHDAAFDPLDVGRKGTSVGVVNVCEREFNIAGEDSYGAAWLLDPRARTAVTSAAAAFDSVVVVVHGGVEYVPFPAPELRRTLREFVDLGADLVIGHHPHVPQGWETYGDGAIFYSLGNFLFDTMSDSRNASWGLAVEVEWAGATPVTVTLVPTERRDGVVHELGGVRDRTDHLTYLHRLTGITGDPDRLEPYWQEVAIRLFHERYSDWLRTGCGATLPRARADPHDPDAQRPLRDPEACTEGILTLLNVTRMASHRWVMTKALAVLAGETADERTPEISAEARWLLSRTAR